jgi:hypothetical protein
VRENLATLNAAVEQGFAWPLPAFVKDELEGYIACGVLARGRLGGKKVIASTIHPHGPETGRAGWHWWAKSMQSTLSSRFSLHSNRALGLPLAAVLSGCGESPAPTGQVVAALDTRLFNGRRSSCTPS